MEFDKCFYCEAKKIDNECECKVEIFTSERIKFSAWCDNLVYLQKQRGPKKIFRHFDFKKMTIYCPFCGQNSVWKSNTRVDFYVGAEHICASCCCVFRLPPAGEEISPRHTMLVEKINNLGR